MGPDNKVTEFPHSSTSMLIRTLTSPPSSVVIKATIAVLVHGPNFRDQSQTLQKPSSFHIQINCKPSRYYFSDAIQRGRWSHSACDGAGKKRKPSWQRLCAICWQRSQFPCQTLTKPSPTKLSAQPRWASTTLIGVKTATPPLQQQRSQQQQQRTSAHTHTHTYI